MDTLTGYKLHKDVNVRLEAEGLKPVKPQMIYRYISEGLIPVETVGDQKLVRSEDAETWIEKYVARRLEKVAGADVTS